MWSNRRRRRGAVAVSALVLVALAAVPLTTHAEDDLPVMVGSQLSPAVQVEIEPRCSEVRFRSPEVKIHWFIDAGAVEGLVGSDELAAATQFRMDTTKFHNGFDSGRYDSLAVQAETYKAGEGGGGVAPAVHSTVIDMLEPGVYYHARVLVQTSEGWIPSSTVGFLSSVCPVDGLDEE